MSLGCDFYNCMSSSGPFASALSSLPWLQHSQSISLKPWPLLIRVTLLPLGKTEMLEGKEWSERNDLHPAGISLRQSLFSWKKVVCFLFIFCECVEKSLGIYLGNNDYSFPHPVRTMRVSYLDLQFENMAGLLEVKPKKVCGCLRI